MVASTELSDFVPVSDWPTLEELVAGFQEPIMPASSKLAGKTFNHVFDIGLRISHQFHDSETLTWKILERDQAGVTGDAQYKAYEVRADIYFVDFYKPDYKEQVSLILDNTTGQAIACVSGFSDQTNERRTWTKFFNAIKNDHGDVKPYETTEELIGKHILYRYSPRDAYEHVDLNKDTPMWHCLSGTEKGLADAELCRMLKLSDSLYLLFWTETIDGWLVQGSRGRWGKDMGRPAERYWARKVLILIFPR
ncbi:molybdenum cofactor biosynthesis protein F [Colletotrichum phormii]|uniref:Molybdenum cofactor biosynthesis protein F n=1 Tax=Colletotrichum phormii TaxID=359342 RepID=A0AAI9ZIB3_9PEZI|nr:molybdenum cofactor biosynthesis protein F [Colletotrichum phormii]KAK1624817.1 molybdenum cofactor biosynthesis protein F [Colletotrichum phormii]